MGRHKKGVTALMRFEESIFYSPDGCWYSLGPDYSTGYASFYLDRLMSAHRASYILHKGEIPTGLQVLHTCDNRKCVNPDHLFLGTNLDNIKDKMSKNRQWRPEGEKCPFVKVSESDVIRIRSLRTILSAKIVGDIFGLSMGHIYKIWWKTSWKHL